LVVETVGELSDDKADVSAGAKRIGGRTRHGDLSKAGGLRSTLLVSSRSRVSLVPARRLRWRLPDTRLEMTREPLEVV
jgi:hypothetical protein